MWIIQNISNFHWTQNDQSVTVKVWIKLPKSFEPIVMPWYDKTGKNEKNLQLKDIAESECICRIYAQIRDAKIMIALQ